MTDYRAILTRLHASNLLAWEDMPADIAREVREALADDSTPSPAPTDSGAEPARGEGASARACWDCRNDGGRTCEVLGRAPGPEWDAVDKWSAAFCDSDGVPIASARNCPGWAPREAGEVSDG